MKLQVLLLAVSLSALRAAAQEDVVTLRASTLLDGAGGRRSDVVVVVRGSKIASVSGPAQGRSYDLTGLTVLPGGIDTHVHLANHFDKDGRAHREAAGREPAEDATLFAVENAYQTLQAGISVSGIWRVRR